MNNDLSNDRKGPIVRVNAHELHIKDVTYYSEVYSGSTRKVNKDASSTDAFGVPTATAATVDHDLHRARRGYITKYFAKRNMSTLEPIVQERLDRLCGRIDERLKTGETLNLDACFSALTADVIARRFYGNDFDYLGSPDFRFVIRNAFMGFTQMYHLAIFMPLTVKILKSMPLSVIRLIAPPVAELQQLKEEIAENGYRKFHAGKWDAEEKKSVIVSSLNDESIPPAERTVDRLVDEGTVILLAGTDTSSRSLAITMFYLLNNPECLARMRHELETSLPLNKDHVYPLAQLEKLPYLVCLILFICVILTKTSNRLELSKKVSVSPLALSAACLESQLRTLSCTTNGLSHQTYASLLPSMSNCPVINKQAKNRLQSACLLCSCTSTKPSTQTPPTSTLSAGSAQPSKASI